MDTGKADRNAVYKKYKFFNRECKQGRSLFFLSVVLSGAALSISAGLTGCSQKDAPVLEHIDIEGSNVLADRGYDSNQLLDYIYERGGEPTIPSRKGAKFERHCDWWLYKERHLVEKYFLKLKGFRRIATRYDKLAATYLGFICIASILIWLK